MKNYRCTCGQVIFFENTQCTACQRRLGYDPEKGILLALDPLVDSDGTQSNLWKEVGGEQVYRLCQNEIDYHTCNWLVPSSEGRYCLSCGLNQIVPGVETIYQSLRKRQWWGAMEQAKRRLIYTLLQLGLPVKNKMDDPASGLAFAFLEDQRSNPRVHEEHVLTGHFKGLITVNLAEADNALRERARQKMGEPYRTLLGHFRHESGHYYFNRLVWADNDVKEFRSLFGDERIDYEQSLANYYTDGVDTAWQSDMISSYAKSHPSEDWAECWAHYLHMIDTLETASEYGLVRAPETQNGAALDIEWCFSEWAGVTVTLNALNRSMGLADAYPFVLSAQTLNKLRFVHRMVYPNWMPTQTVASV